MEKHRLFERTGYRVMVEQVWKSYRVGEEVFNALQGATCTILDGHVTVIQGPSGCGKSTLLNMVGGVDHQDSGRLTLGPHCLDGATSERALSVFRLREVGFVFQAYNLIAGLTALENLLMPMTVAGVDRAALHPRAHALLDLVGMADKLKKRPDALSGGEQQRVAVALALVNDPPLILADEPTGNLDTSNALRVTDLLCSLAREYGKTVVITTHDPLVAGRGDQVLQMRDGAFK